MLGCGKHLGSPQAGCKACYLQSVMVEVVAKKETLQPVVSALPPCPHRGQEIGAFKCIEGCPSRIKLKVFECDLHGKCSIEKQTEANTAVCKRCADNPALIKSTSDWVVAMTCVESRLNNTIPRTMDSLKNAGFPEPHLFIDGGNYANWTHLKVRKTFRETNVLTFGNWMLMAWEMSLLHPTIDRYLFVQDDVVFSRNVRQYLDSIKWPEDGYLNLFLHPKQGKIPKTEGFEISDQFGWGALALAFNRVGLEKILSHKGMAERMRLKLPKNKPSWKAVDGAIVTAARKNGIKEYVHLPSLTNHIGFASVMGNGGTNGRQSNHFKGEDFDAMSIHKPAPLIQSTSKKVWRWHSTADLTNAAIKLASMLPKECVGVIGIPRSGMLPAGVIATHLHLPLFELTPDGPRMLNSGRRGGWDKPSPGTYALVDDTVASGKSMREASNKARTIGFNILRCAVFCSDHSRDAVDLFAEASPLPHALEWNWANNNAAFGFGSRNGLNAPWGDGVAIDFDGVLCVDPVVMDKDEAAYTKWLMDARPLTLPRRRPLKLIVTARMERYRQLTLDWLKSWGISVERLVMHPEGPRTFDSTVHLKASTYRESRCGLFLESDKRLAKAIFEQSRKPVVCTQTGEVWE